MLHEDTRLLLFHIFPKSGVVEDATGWEFRDIEGKLRAECPDFGSWDSAKCSSIEELESVKAVYNALSALHHRTRSAKSTECKKTGRHEVLSEYGLIPLSLDEKDYLYWARKTVWLPSEAILLSLGLIPNSDIIDEFNKIIKTNFGFCRLLKEYGERHDLYFDAIGSGRLEANNSSLDFVDWFEQNEFDLPEGFSLALRRLQGLDTSFGDPKSTSEETKDLLPREKETLLRLIAGMSIAGYRFDVNASRNDATREIQGDLDQLGIPLDPKTILKWLREASNLMGDSQDYRSLMCTRSAHAPAPTEASSKGCYQD